ncbi:hypothetical protein ACFSWD_31515 [Paenibacillus xanthanilyticus]
MLHLKHLQLETIHPLVELSGDFAELARALRDFLRIVMFSAQSAT